MNKSRTKLTCLMIVAALATACKKTATEAMLETNSMVTIN